MTEDCSSLAPILVECRRLVLWLVSCVVKHSRSPNPRDIAEDMPPLCSLLPQVYYFIGRSLNATLSQLGTLVLCRALVQVRE